MTAAMPPTATTNAPKAKKRPEVDGHVPPSGRQSRADARVIMTAPRTARPHTPAVRCPSLDRLPTTPRAARTPPRTGAALANQHRQGTGDGQHDATPHPAAGLTRESSRRGRHAALLDHPHTALAAPDRGAAVLEVRAIGAVASWIAMLALLPQAIIGAVAGHRSLRRTLLLGHHVPGRQADRRRVPSPADTGRDAGFVPDGAQRSVPAVAVSDASPAAENRESSVPTAKHGGGGTPHSQLDQAAGRAFGWAGGGALSRHDGCRVPHDECAAAVEGHEVFSVG